MRQLLLAYIITLGAVFLLHAQSASPTGIVSPPKAIYTPKPVYRPEWVRQGLAGKGVVLVTIDKETGRVTGAPMLQSTGSKLLDGYALEAYSQ
jgi:outer membrane biosynthesis protein TonB